MAISDDQIRKWIRTISKLPIHMDPEALVDDIVLMAFVYSDPAIFELLMGNVYRALEDIVEDNVSTSQLVNNYKGWESYHFQSRRENGFKADLRIVFRRVDGSIQIKGFGNRHLPLDIYDRLKSRNS